MAAPDEHVVGDVEIARTGPVGVDATAHVLEAHALHYQPLRAGKTLVPGLYRHLGVAQRQSFKIQVAGGHDIEQDVVVAAIEDHFTIAGRLDHDGLLCGAALAEVVGAVEQYAQLLGIAEAVGLVESGMHQDHVTGLYTRRVGVEPVGAVGPLVIRGQQACEGRLLALAFMAGRIHMEYAAACRHLRLRSRPDGCRVPSRALDTIGITERQLHLVVRVGFEVDEAAGKLVGYYVREGAHHIVHLLAAQAQQR